MVSSANDIGGFSEGYGYVSRNLGAFQASSHGASYVGTVEKEIGEITRNMNRFEGFATKSAVLKGNIAETWHSGTHNIDAALKGSPARTDVLHSHGFGSVDIVATDGQNIGLKYFRNAEESARQQAKSYFEAYKEYIARSKTSQAERLTFDDYLLARNLSSDEVWKFDPIYSGQVRVIPADQLEEAIAFLQKKILKEAGSRPEQVARYQEALALLTDKIETRDGARSIPLTKAEAEQLARTAKEGKFDPGEHGLTTEDLVTAEYLTNQCLKAGITAASISLALKVAPEIYSSIVELLRHGQIDSGRFQKIGIAAATGASEGFIRGAVASALVIACHSGKLGESFKTIAPSVVGAMTVIVIDTIKNSFAVAAGLMTKGEMADQLVRSLYASTGAVVMGATAQTLFVQAPGIAYLIGSFVGSLAGSMAYQASYTTYLSFAVRNGCTFFGLVDQDYRLPANVLSALSIETLAYDQTVVEQVQITSFQPTSIFAQEVAPRKMKIAFVRRGVIGVNQIGYV